MGKHIDYSIDTGVGMPDGSTHSCQVDGETRVNLPRLLTLSQKPGMAELATGMALLAGYTDSKDFIKDIDTAAHMMMVVSAAAASLIEAMQEDDPTGEKYADQILELTERNARHLVSSMPETPLIMTLMALINATKSMCRDSMQSPEDIHCQSVGRTIH